MKDKIALKSTFLETAEYDDKSRTMLLTFKNGTQYSYLNMFESTWASFKQAQDHSSYYSRAIKGRIQSVPIKRNVIGFKKSTPLKINKQNRSLKIHGLDIGNASKRPTRSPGLIPSSFGR